MKELDAAGALYVIINFDELGRSRTVGGLEVSATIVALIGLLGFLRAAFGVWVIELLCKVTNARNRCPDGFWRDHECSYAARHRSRFQSRDSRSCCRIFTFLGCRCRPLPDPSGIGRQPKSALRQE